MRQQHTFHAITYKTYTRTEINLGIWGVPFLLALQEITETKQHNISPHEIKTAMQKHLETSLEIPNYYIGYALKHFGLNDKVHESDGNHYNISKQQLEAILTREGLKP